MVPDASPLQPLIDDARAGRSRIDSVAFATTRLDPTEAAMAVDVVCASPDHSSYLVLLALKSQAKDSYASVPASVRAAIFCGALEHQQFLNDFGYLEPSESYDGPSAKALLATGDAAIPCLRQLLDVDAPAPLMGSEESALSALHAYRRADFAYRYLAKLVGHDPPFRASPQERDQDIAALKRELERASP